MPRKLIIELPHPVDELKTLSDALKALSQPGLPRKEILRQRRVIKAARASQRVLRAYNCYLRFRVSVLERQIGEK